jgi:hypothetical protein
MNIEIGNKKIDFVYQGDNLIYPNYPARENLILHYDFSGMKNSDVTKAIARDLSGNGNNGELQNFAYTDESGYLDNTLIFDGIDDFITIPEPQIDLDNFTYSEGINVFSFRGDQVATVVNGVVEIGGRNLIVNTEILQMSPTSIDAGYYSLTLESIDGDKPSLFIIKHDPSVSSYTLSYKTDTDNLSVTRVYYWSEKPTNSHVSNRIGWETNVKSGSQLIIPNDPNIKYIGVGINGFSLNSEDELPMKFWDWKLEKGTVATPWTPAPEDLKKTTFKPLFDKKIKSALYWNRALTDEELLQVYNIQIKRT